MNTATATGDVLVSAGSSLGIAVTGGGLTVHGGMSHANISGPGANTVSAATDVSLLGLVDKTVSVSGDLNIIGGNTTGNGIVSATGLLDPGALNITTGGNVFLTGGSGPGTGVLVEAMGPINFTIGGLTGLKLTGGMGSGIFPTPSVSGPITLTFTGGGSQKITIDPLLGTAIVESFLVIPPNFDQLLSFTIGQINNPPPPLPRAEFIPKEDTGKQKDEDKPTCS
jgi:hypothetical protein